MPRYIAVAGDVIKSQIYQNFAMYHEMASLVVRRLGQIDEALHRDTPGERWRKIMEPDFAVSKKSIGFFQRPDQVNCFTLILMICLLLNFSLTLSPVSQ